MTRRLGVAGAAVVACLAASPLGAQAPGAPEPPAAGRAALGPVRSLSLEDALRLAEPASENLLIARAGVTRAEGDVSRARASFLPQLNGFAQYQRTLRTQYSSLGATTPTTTPSLACGTFAPNPGLPLADRVDSLEKAVLCASSPSSNIFANLPFARPNIWSLGLSASLSVFNGRYFGQRRAANAGRESATLELTSQRAQVIVDVVRAYYDATLNDRLLAIAESTLAQAERTLRDVELQRRVGNQSEFERLRAVVARDNQKPAVLSRRTQRALARVRLAQLLNLPSADSLNLTTELGDTTGAPLPPFARDIAAAADTSVASRVPVRKAEASLRQQEGLYSAAKLERAPSLSVSSTFQQIAYPTAFFPAVDRFLTDWNLVVRMDVPLFTGGRLRGDALTAQAGRDDAAARLALAREQAARELTDVQSTLAASIAQWEAVSGTVEQARTAYGIAEVRFREGISTQTELNDARLQLQQAEANRAQAARDLQVARVRAALLRDLPFDTGATPAQPAVATTASQASTGATAASGTAATVGGTTAGTAGGTVYTGGPQQ
jgi:outer membrane protein TolC